LRHNDNADRKYVTTHHAKSLQPFGGSIGISTAVSIRMRNKTRIQSLWIIVVALLLPVAGMAMMQMASTGDRALNDYMKGRVDDPIARLQQKIDGGTLNLPFDKKWGYLPAVLRAMKIPESTQTLVFSKTSFQIDHISRRTPRALYYNDDVYVGWVQGGPVLELASVDPVLGTIFRSLNDSMKAVWCAMTLRPPAEFPDYSCAHFLSMSMATRS
jgi:hypothetical protein